MVGACVRSYYESEVFSIIGEKYDAPTWALLPPALIFLSVPTTAPDRRAYRDASHLRLNPLRKIALTTYRCGIGQEMSQVPTRCTEQ
jgi:hypothetical protein